GPASGRGSCAAPGYEEGEQGPEQGQQRHENENTREHLCGAYPGCQAGQQQEGPSGKRTLPRPRGNAPSLIRRSQIETTGAGERQDKCQKTHTMPLWDAHSQWLYLT